MTDRLEEIKVRRADSHPFLTSAQIDWLVHEVDRQRFLLGQLEWAGTFACAGHECGFSICPVCEQDQRYGLHTTDCWLAAELPRP